MSWKYHKKNIEGVRKVKWDDLWHILYSMSGKDTWDRVDKKTAMYVVSNMNKWRTFGTWDK